MIWDAVISQPQQILYPKKVPSPLFHPQVKDLRQPNLPNHSNALDQTHLMVLCLLYHTNYTSKPLHARRLPSHTNCTRKPFHFLVIAFYLPNHRIHPKLTTGHQHQIYVGLRAPRPTVPWTTRETTFQFRDVVITKDHKLLRPLRPYSYMNCTRKPLHSLVIAFHLPSHQSQICVCLRATRPTVPWTTRETTLHSRDVITKDCQEGCCLNTKLCLLSPQMQVLPSETRSTSRPYL